MSLVDDAANRDYKLLTIRLRVDCMMQSYNSLIKGTDLPRMIVKYGTKKRKRKPRADSETGGLAETSRSGNRGPIE